MYRYMYIQYNLFYVSTPKKNKLILAMELMPLTIYTVHSGREFKINEKYKGGEKHLLR